MSRIKDAVCSYEKELLKQKEPYEHYIRYIDTGLKGEPSSVPFICTCDEYPEGTKDSTQHSGGTKDLLPHLDNAIKKNRVYDYGDYILYEDADGYSYDGEKAFLINEARKLDADLIFSDIDFVDENNKRRMPFYKPDFDIDTYEAFDYISDFYAVKKQLNNTPIINLKKISHVTKVLYHSFYGKDKKTDDAAGYINEKYNNRYITPDHYSDDSIINESVGIVIPSKDNPDLLQKCLTGIQYAKIKSKINTIKVCIVDNGSSEDNKYKITHIIENFRHHERNNPDNSSSDNSILDISYIYEPGEFNFSKMCNRGASECKTDYLLFMNDDIEITDDDFIVKLLYYARKPHVGAVGCKLLYPDGVTIQHVGITGLKFAGPSHKLSTFKDDKCLYFGRNRGIHNCLAVTGACLMVSSDKFFKTGGFCDKMKVGYNDVDLCVSLYENGYHNIVNNELCLIHHESVTRGADAESLDKLSRLKEERGLLYERHPFLNEKGDPYYNPNLAGDFLDYRVNVIADFENRAYRSKQISEDECRKGHTTFAKLHSLTAKQKKPKNKNLFCNIESTDIKIDPETLKKYIEIKGWALVNKRNNSFYNTYLHICIDNINAPMIFTTAPMYRADLQSVFPDAKNCDLSGFLARIDLDDTAGIKEPEEISNLRCGVILHNKIGSVKWIMGIFAGHA